MLLPWQRCNYRDFESKNWNRLNFVQRVDALQGLENEMARQQGREPRTLVPETMEPSTAGYYNQEDPLRIYINESNIYSNEPGNNYDLMDTVIHEGRHAYQDDCIYNRLKDGYIEKESAEKFRYYQHKTGKNYKIA